jgi:hypothetical protein
LFENHSENNLQPDFSNDTIVNRPLFSLVNTFKGLAANAALFDIFLVFHITGNGLITSFSLANYYGF